MRYSENQHRLGYIYLGASLVPIAMVCAMVFYFSYPAIVLLGAIPPVVITVFFGYKKLDGTTDDAVTEERQSDSKEAANWTLLILFGVMTVDGFFELVPGEGRPVVYLSIGSASFFLFYFYYTIS